jgi:hypothetical protein
MTNEQEQKMIDILDDIRTAVIAVGIFLSQSGREVPSHEALEKLLAIAQRLKMISGG